MKLFIVLSALVVVVSAGSYGSSSNGNGYGSGNSLGSDGMSNQYRNDDSYGNYQFGYDESHASGGSSRHEEETNGVRRGSYSLTDADGRRRTVRYVADAHGFRATVDTNEPGTDSTKNPADVIMNGGGQLSEASMGGYGASAQTGYASAAPAPRYTAQASYAAPQPQLMSYQQQAAPRSSYSEGSALVSNSYNSYNSNQAPLNTYSTETASYGQETAPTPRAFSYSFSTAHPASRSSYSAPAMQQSYSAPAYQTARTYSAPSYSSQIEAPRAMTSSYSTGPAMSSSYSSRPSGYGMQQMAARGGY